MEDGDRTQPADVKFLSTSGKGAWIRVVMGEGKKRQIRETGKLLGLPVVRIIRLRIGTLKLDDLKPRQWRYLTEDEVAALKGEKGKIIEKVRDKRRHPTDRLKRVPSDKKKLGPNEKPRTKDKNSRSDWSRGNAKPRTSRR